jgi:hypothetical protein
MASPKKKAKAKAAGRFKNLTSKKNPKGDWSGSDGDIRGNLGQTVTVSKFT